MNELPAIDQLDAQTVASLIAIFIPALTAALTKWNTASWVRTVVALFLSAVTGAASTLVGGDGDFDWKTFVLSTLYAFVVNIAMYVGVYKPQKIARAIAASTAGFGIGSSRPEPTQLPADPPAV